MALNIKLPADCQQVISNFIKSKVRDSATNGIIVGLSGGLDSAVVLKLCSDALGADSATALLMPETRDGDEHFKDAEELAKGLGVRYHLIEIEPIIDLFLTNSKPEATNVMALANLKARIRAVMLYHYANSENLLVAGTSNKSELMIGYFTKYGDGGSDIAPIGDLYKTQVNELARELELPEHLITKVPTAGLLPDQTDEAELGMTYEVLDRLLLGLELQVPMESIASTLELPVAEIERMNKLSETSRHKRKFSKIPKLGIKTVGTDLRE